MPWTPAIPVWVSIDRVGFHPRSVIILRKISSMRVVQIITAGGKGEQVQEKEGHGLFTTYFLQALEGEADFNKDNVVTGTELGPISGRQSLMPRGRPKPHYTAGLKERVSFSSLSEKK